jgi:hypothetical protein
MEDLTLEELPMLLEQPFRTALLLWYYFASLGISLNTSLNTSLGAPLRYASFKATLSFNELRYTLRLKER